MGVRWQRGDTTGAPTEHDRARSAGPASDPAEGPRSPRAAFRAAPPLRSLTGRTRIAVYGLLALAVLLPLASALLAVSDGWVATGDNALIGLRTQDVLDLDLPLVGQPTTGENYSDAVPSSHPGAMEFYLLAPFVGLFGADAGLALGAAAINAAALFLTILGGFRRGGSALAGLVATGAVLASWSLGLDQLHDPLSSVMGVFPALCMLVLGWCLIDGDDAMTVPWVLAATFTLQVHLSYLAFGGPFVAVVVAVVLVRAVRQGRRRRSGQRLVDWLSRHQRPLVVGTFAGIVLWLPVFVEQFTASTGNLTAIADTLGTNSAPGRGMGFGVDRLLLSVAPPPLVTRQLTELQHLDALSGTAKLLGVATLLLVVALVLVVRRRSKWPVTSLGLVVAFTAATGIYSASSLPGAATLKVANFRWMWIVSALAWVTILWLAYLWGSPRLGRARRAVPLVVLALAVATGGLALSSYDAADERDASVIANVAALRSEVREGLPKGAYRVRLVGASSLLTVGPAVIYDLESRGYQVYVSVGAFSRAYGDVRTFRDQSVDGTVIVQSSTDPEAVPADGEVIAEGSFADSGGAPYKVWVSVE